MTATPINELLSEAGCYLCFTDGSLVDAIKLALLSRIAQRL